MKQNYKYGAQVQRIDDDFRARVTARVTGVDIMPPGGSEETAGWSVEGMPDAMVYAPRSTFDDLFADDEGLCRGTIFKDLYFPFEAAYCGNGGMR